MKRVTTEDRKNPYVNIYEEKGKEPYVKKKRKNPYVHICEEKERKTYVDICEENRKRKRG